MAQAMSTAQMIATTSTLPTIDPASAHQDLATASASTSPTGNATEPDASNMPATPLVPPSGPVGLAGE